MQGTIVVFVKIERSVLDTKVFYKRETAGGLLDSHGPLRIHQLHDGDVSQKELANRFVRVVCRGTLLWLFVFFALH